MKVEIGSHYAQDGKLVVTATKTPHPEDRVYIDPSKVHKINSDHGPMYVLNPGWITGFTIHRDH